ncbi:MAG: hypothetical protein CMO80_21570 [Verrucomicrobiales bacterium]|nr:hypothetical protein [Verrucomicrobiales bacterium]
MSLMSFFVYDFARNRTQVIFELGLDPNEPLDHIKKRKRLKCRTTTRALRILLGFPAKPDLCSYKNRSLIAFGPKNGGTPLQVTFLLHGHGGVR